MVRKTIIGLCILMLGVANSYANQIILIDQESEWEYTTLNFDLWPDMDAEFSDFDWDSATYNTGLAAFGNASDYNTYWAPNTDLALRQSFEFTGDALGDLRLNVASDNGFIIFLNGVEISNENAEGFTSRWEYELDVSSASLVNGMNTVSVFAEDHGGLTYFDMQLVANVSSPSAVALLALGIVGIAFSARRK
jgi:hypothetical protein